MLWDRTTARSSPSEEDCSPSYNHQSCRHYPTPRDEGVSQAVRNSADMYISPRNFQAEFYPVPQSVRDPELERRIVLLGRSGAGKSASANTLFGRHVFLESRWGRFHTTECQRGIITRYGRRLEVVDTPGFLLDADINNTRVKREFSKFVGISSPGPHIFVFVFPTPHMHKCDAEIFQKFIYVFGEDVLNYTLLLFSKADDLDYFSLTKQAFILSAPSEWKAIMKACNYRCVWFQNRSSPLDKELMVRTFMETMENMISKNLGRYFSNAMYWTVERSIIRKLLKQHDNNVKLDKLRRRLRLNLDAGMKPKHSDTKKDPMKTRIDFRDSLENNNLKVIDTIWNTVKYFDCLRILQRPRLPMYSDEHTQDTPEEEPNEEVEKVSKDVQAEIHILTAEVTKKGKLPKISREVGPRERLLHRERRVKEELRKDVIEREPQTDRRARDRLPKIVPWKKTRLT